MTPTMTPTKRLTLPPRPDEPLLAPKEAAALLGIGLSTFYTLAWFKARKVRVSKGRVGFHPSDVRLYIQLRSEAA